MLAPPLATLSMNHCFDWCNGFLQQPVMLLSRWFCEFQLVTFKQSSPFFLLSKSRTDADKSLSLKELVFLLGMDGCFLLPFIDTNLSNLKTKKLLSICFNLGRSDWITLRNQQLVCHFCISVPCCLIVCSWHNECECIYFSVSPLNP